MPDYSFWDLARYMLKLGTLGFSAPPIDLDTGALEATLRAKGTANAGVHGFNIPRADRIRQRPENRAGQSEAGGPVSNGT